MFFFKIVQIEKQRFCGVMKWSLVPLPGATCIFFFFFKWFIWSSQRDWVSISWLLCLVHRPKLQRKPLGWRRGGGRAYNRRCDMRSHTLARIPYTGVGIIPPRRGTPASARTSLFQREVARWVHYIHLSRCGDVRVFLFFFSFPTSLQRSVPAHRANTHIQLQTADAPFFLPPLFFLSLLFIFCTDDINYSSHLAAHKYHPGRLI